MKNTILIKLDPYEHGYLFQVLNEKRNQMLQNQEDTENIDELLLRVIDAKEKKLKKERDSHGR